MSRGIFQFRENIVTVPSDPAHKTANLKGPVLSNTRNKPAKQLVIDNPDYEFIIHHRATESQSKHRGV
jgi:flagellar assembly factor FliW